MRFIKKPKPLRNTKRLLNSFNADTLFGMVTELPQSYNHLFDFATFFNTKKGNAVSAVKKRFITYKLKENGKLERNN